MKEETTRSFLIIAFLMFTVSFAVADTPSTLSCKNDDIFLGGPVPGLADTLYYELDQCTDRIEVCLAIPTSDLTNYQITDNGGPYASGIQGCDFDTLSLYRYFLLPGSGGLGPYVLQSWGIDGSSFSAPFNTMSDLVDSMNVWDPAANWILDPVNFIISGGSSSSSYSDMQVWHPSNTNPTILPREDHPIALGTMLNFGYGSHQLILRDILLGTADTTQLYISCTTPDNQSFDILFGTSDTLCIDFGELLFPVVSVVNDCPETSDDPVAFSFINNDSCVVFTGQGIGTDTACIIACDEGGVCDTTYISVTTEANYQVGSRSVYDTIVLGETLRQCIDLTVFGGSMAAEITSFCADSAGTFVNGVIDTSSFCIDFTGISSPGSDNFCLEVCDTAGVCDTTFYHIFVEAPTSVTIQDTLLLYDALYFCDLHMANLATAPFSIINGCPAAGMGNVSFEIDTLDQCVSIEALAVGSGMACIYIQDSLGNVDTTFIEIVVKLPTAERNEVTIMVGDSIQVCIDTIELAGRLEELSNGCPSNGKASFSFDESTMCFDIYGMEVGTDTACYFFCDQYGLCDSILWRVNVIESTAPRPIIGDDYSSVVAGNELAINLCENDIFPSGNWSSIALLSSAEGGLDPQYGSVTLDTLNCSLIYTAFDTDCEIQDGLMYQICDGLLCDTAYIFVDILCESSPLKFYSGFSPNGDSRNEFFQIDGLEAYPDHQLTIFNRWGLKIFEATNYQNDWQGTFQGEALPDGIYFYLFDNGVDEQFTGSVVINR